MFFGILFITSALVLYTIAIFSERKMGYIHKWILAVFASGFTCDLIGTSIMSCQTESHTVNVHMCCGLAALLIMLLHLSWAILAMICHGKTAHYFHRCSLYAWGIWLIAFITGGAGSMMHN
jgi:uncharacterized repeat protein (TIGR03987 family)